LGNEEKLKCGNVGEIRTKARNSRRSCPRHTIEGVKGGDRKGRAHKTPGKRSEEGEQNPKGKLK